VKKCRTCPGEAAPGHTRCEGCLARLREYAAARRKRHRERGLCRMCVAPAVVGTAHCLAHLEYYRRRHRAERGHAPWRPGGKGRTPTERETQR
jgi:hypothetical protein